MRRMLSIGLSCFIAALSLASTKASAQLPGLTHYHLVPRHSSFTKTGGFAGVNERYRLRGEYDFVESMTSIWRVGEDGVARHDGFQFTARFDNADIRAPLGPMLPAFIDVDHLLNLEGLRGELLPLGAPFDVYRFRGRINDSDAASPLEQSTIELFAAQFGPWMYLYGETTPPIGSADYFRYEIKALARTRPWADRNDDGVVDIADYTLLRDGGDLDPVAYSDWRRQFGERLPDLDQMAATLSASLSSVTAAPEPSVLPMLLAAGPLFLRWRPVA